jgi:hypothetical protein
MRNWIDLFENYLEIEKFWINSNTGELEYLPEDGEQEHETDLPGDQSLGFNDSIAAGWVRGGYKSGYDTSMYLQGHDALTVRKALKTALDIFAPEQVTVEWGSTFARLEGKQIDRFMKNGSVPKVRDA